MDTTTLPTVPDRDFWSSSDPLGQVLHLMRMSGTFYALSELSAPWGMDMPAIPDSMMFHFVTEGRCWVFLRFRSLCRCHYRDQWFPIRDGRLRRTRGHRRRLTRRR